MSTYSNNNFKYKYPIVFYKLSDTMKINKFVGMISNLLKNYYTFTKPLQSFTNTKIILVKRN